MNVCNLSEIGSMLNTLMNPLRHRFAKSLNWRVAEMKSQLMGMADHRLTQTESQIDQLNSIVANMAIAIADQQNAQAVLIEKLYHRISALEKNTHTSVSVET